MTVLIEIGAFMSMLGYSSAAPVTCPLKSQIEMIASYTAGFSAKITSQIHADGKDKPVSMPALPGINALFGQQPSLFSFRLEFDGSFNGEIKPTYYMRTGNLFSVKWIDLPSLEIKPVLHTPESLTVGYTLTSGASQIKQGGLISFSVGCPMDANISVYIKGYPFVKTDLQVSARSMYQLAKKTGMIYYSIFADRYSFYKDLHGSIEDQIGAIRDNEDVSKLLAAVGNLPKADATQVLSKWISKRTSYIERAEFYPFSAHQTLVDKTSDLKGMAVLLVILGKLAGLDLHLVLASSNAPNLDFGGLSMPLVADCWLVYDAESGKFFDFSLLKGIETVSSYKNIIGKRGEEMFGDGNYRPIYIAAGSMFKN